MATQAAPMIEEMRARAEEGKSPFGGFLQILVEEATSRSFPRLMRSPASIGKRVRVWQSFENVEELNDSLDDRTFISDWRSVREREGHIINLTGTLFPYEPICAGSSRMWRTYWTDMEKVLIARMGPVGSRSSLGRKEKVRDWFTQSLFLWGFSMAQESQPGEPHWLGIGFMDEINSIPIAFAPAAWDGRASSLFAGRERAWNVRLTAHLERRPPATASPGRVREVFKTLERPYYLVVQSPDQVEVLEKSVFFSAYTWGLFETPKGDAYGLWEHTNIADPDLFEEGIGRLARKIEDLCDPKDRLVAALTAEVAAAIQGKLS
jgi:hypothetical protein